jgi:hypothetical protein
VVISSCSCGWWAGVSYGSRLFTDMVPYLVLLLLPVIDTLTGPLRRPPGSGPVRSRVALTATLAALVAGSVAIQAPGALNRDTVTWNAAHVSSDPPKGMWNWGEAQFLS